MGAPRFYGWGFSVHAMPKGLKRYYGLGHLHFLTFSCYRRLPLLRTVAARNLFVRALGVMRQRHGFLLVGYVVMPEHVHLAGGRRVAQARRVRFLGWVPHVWPAGQTWGFGPTCSTAVTARNRFPRRRGLCPSTTRNYSTPNPSDLSPGGA